MVSYSIVQPIGFFIMVIFLILDLKLSTLIIREIWQPQKNHKNFSRIDVNLNERLAHNRSILLAVGVLNRISLKKRREVIRLTWMKVCKDARQAKCYFFTDDFKGLNESEVKEIEREKEKHKDMLFMPIKGGHAFGLRLVWMLEWFTRNYDFQYFLRLDDDYFVCFDRLLYELPFRPKTGLYWGYTHCTDNVIRVDEGWMLLSRDIIEEALSKFNTTLICHPFGDQTVALWLKDSQLKINWFPDNRRVIHQATAYNEQRYMVPGFCRVYLAMHGAYTIQMLKFWILSRDYSREKVKYHVPNIPYFTSFCAKNRTFDLNAFWGHVRFYGKPCKDNPTWSITGSKFIGREEYGEDMIY